MACTAWKLGAKFHAASLHASSGDAQAAYLSCSMLSSIFYGLHSLKVEWSSSMLPACTPAVAKGSQNFKGSWSRLPHKICRSVGPSILKEQT